MFLSRIYSFGRTVSAPFHGVAKKSDDHSSHMEFKALIYALILVSTIPYIQGADISISVREDYLEPGNVTDAFLVRNNDWDETPIEVTIQGTVDGTTSNVTKSLRSYSYTDTSNLTITDTTKKVCGSVEYAEDTNTTNNKACFTFQTDEDTDPSPQVPGRENSASTCPEMIELEAQVIETGETLRYTVGETLPVQYGVEKNGEIIRDLRTTMSTNPKRFTPNTPGTYWILATTDSCRDRALFVAKPPEKAPRATVNSVEANQGYVSFDITLEGAYASTISLEHEGTELRKPLRFTKLDGRVTGTMWVPSTHHEDYVSVRATAGEAESTMAVYVKGEPPRPRIKRVAARNKTLIISMERSMRGTVEVHSSKTKKSLQVIDEAVIRTGVVPNATYYITVHDQQGRTDTAWTHHKPLPNDTEVDPVRSVERVEAPSIPEKGVPQGAVVMSTSLLTLSAGILYVLRST